MTWLSVSLVTQNSIIFHFFEVLASARWTPKRHIQSLTLKSRTFRFGKAIFLRNDKQLVTSPPPMSLLLYSLGETIFIHCNSVFSDPQILKSSTAFCHVMISLNSELCFVLQVLEPLSPSETFELPGKKNSGGTVLLIYSAKLTYGD